MTFSGFGEHAVEFFDELTSDNSKHYWDAHKDIYVSDIRAPMEALVGELEKEFGGKVGSGKVFRPYRDVRFAKDKTPYKTNCGGVIEHGRGGGAYYVEVSSSGLMVGGGCFHMHSDQITRYRTAVSRDLAGPMLEKIMTKLRKQGWEIRGDQMKTRPREYPADHPRIDLLRYRGSVYAVKVWDPDDVLHDRACLDRVRKAWRELRPFNEWAVDHVGVSEQPRR